MVNQRKEQELRDLEGFLKSAGDWLAVFAKKHRRACTNEKCDALPRMIAYLATRMQLTKEEIQALPAILFECDLRSSVRFDA